MAEFVTLCPADEIPDGTREVFNIGNHWIAVFNVGGTYYAVEDICTHDGNVLTEDEDGNEVPLDGYCIKCPRHGAVFDIRDGGLQSGPAGTVDLPQYAVRLQDGDIQILF